LSAAYDHPLSAPGERRYTLSIAGLQRSVLWFFVFCGCFAIIEPSPYEFMFLVTVFVFLITGIRLNQRVLPVVITLLAFNIGGIIALIPFMDESLSVRFIAIGIYLMFTTFLFAALMSDDAVGRLDTMRRALIASAWVAAIAGILGYFNIAGLGDIFTLYGRASGTFKDPNVYGPYIAIALGLMVQFILVGRTSLVKGVLLMSVPLLGLFLSFSRGAWGNFVLITLIVFTVNFIIAETAAQRARIVGFALLIAGGAVAGLLVAISFEPIREVFVQRASLVQSYDGGVQGRFGNQLRSISMLLDMPNGMGPLRFRFYFPDDPHNTFINAFASYGWIGGFSYAALVASTMVVGWMLVFRPAPTQIYAIPLWAALFTNILQGVQIDIDHWRHFYLLLGLVWGLAAITPPKAKT
jgi:O-antigen ligase